MVLINQMLPDEVCFLSYRFSSSEIQRIEPKSKAVLKYATSTDNETFIDLVVVYEDGLVILHKSETFEIWANKKPNFKTVDGEVIVTF
nr:MAG TPA: hypothetical protein [Caudoviricetes sp.]